MRINLFSCFAAGILFATTICGVAYFTDKSVTSKPSAKTIQKPVTVNLTEAEMKDKLATNGFVVQTKAEYDKNLNDAKVAGQKQAPAQDKKPNKTVTRVVIHVSQGMTSIDVGKMLKKAKFVPNAYKFSMDVEKRKLDTKLKPGTFIVNSEMTYDQMIRTIFKE